MRAAPNLGDEYVRDFEAVFTDLAKTYDTLFYPFFLEGVAAQAKYALRDGVHPNEAGVNAIVTGNHAQGRRADRARARKARVMTLAVTGRIPSLWSAGRNYRPAFVTLE